MTFKRKFNFDFDVVLSKTLQKRIINIICHISREYITSIMTKALVANGGIDR